MVIDREMAMQNGKRVSFPKIPRQMTLDFDCESRSNTVPFLAEKRKRFSSGLCPAPYYAIAADHYRATGQKDRRFVTEQDDYP